MSPDHVLASVNRLVSAYNRPPSAFMRFAGLALQQMVDLEAQQRRGAFWLMDRACHDACHRLDLINNAEAFGKHGTLHLCGLPVYLRDDMLPGELRLVAESRTCAEL